MRAVEESVKAHEDGHRVLITCMAGRNRSGLVTAWALSVLGGRHPLAAGDSIHVREAVPGRLVRPRRLRPWLVGSVRLQA